MGKGKTMAITAVATCGLAAALILAASMTNLFLAGDYYVKIDNAHISENESSGGVINLGSSEPYLYKLEAVNAAGDKTEIEFGASRELHQNAFFEAGSSTDSRGRQVVGNLRRFASAQGCRSP